MDFDKMLSEKKCSCGMTHSCDIKKVIIKSGAINELSSLLDNYNNILLVADNNTWQTCGEKIKNITGDKLENQLIYISTGYLVPNEAAIEQMQNQLSKKTDLIIGIGSGVIQDLCKYVSFEANLPYYIIATAPSMDGYASVGAAMIIGNMKITYSAHVPEVIIGDTDILKNAPIDMIKSGYGDILGKYSCLNDWKLSTAVNGEYFCEEVYSLTYDMLLKTKDIGAQLINRDEEAIKILTEALVGVGIAMAYVGNSRPASGSEHHLSHYFEVVGIMKNEPYFMHGIDVAFSAVYTQKLREKLLLLETPDNPYSFDRTAWESKIKSIYADAADGVIALQNKLGWYNEDKIDIYKEKWHEIKNILKEVPSSQELISYLKSVDLDIEDFEKTYGNEKINDAILYAKDLKDRYTVLWLAYRVLNKNTERSVVK